MYLPYKLKLEIKTEHLHRPTKFYDQNVTGQWTHVSGLIFQADFESEIHFSLSGLVLLT